MSEVGLYLDLATELVLHSALEELGFAEDLESHNVFGSTFAGEVHLAEFAAAEGLADFEIVQGPTGAGFGLFGVECGRGELRFLFGVVGRGIEVRFDGFEGCWTDAFQCGMGRRRGSCVGSMDGIFLVGGVGESHFELLIVQIGQPLKLL